MWFYDEKGTRLHYGVKSHIKSKSDEVVMVDAFYGVCQPAGEL
jgi:hypothetical protein